MLGGRREEKERREKGERGGRGEGERRKGGRRREKRGGEWRKGEGRMEEMGVEKGAGASGALRILTSLLPLKSYIEAVRPLYSEVKR